MGHSLSEGDLGFETEGSVEYIPPAKVAAAVKGNAQVENIDFRGCSVGRSPAGMEKIRAALRARKARGSTCFLVKWVQGPIKGFTRRRDLTNKNKHTFDEGLNILRDAFGDAKRCILNNSQAGYFQAGAKLVALWASPDLDTAWQERKSICYSELKEEKVDPAKQPEIDSEECKLVEIGK
jgi:hypothetical protein